MKRQSSIAHNILFFILLRLMDCEEIMWNIAEFFIKPVARMRGEVAKRLKTMQTSGQKHVEAE